VFGKYFLAAIRTTSVKSALTDAATGLVMKRLKPVFGAEGTDELESSIVTSASLLVAEDKDSVVKEGTTSKFVSAVSP
jgi:hypothetical protein